jgi:hypothetical protein
MSASLRSRVNAELAALAAQHGTLKQQHVLDAAREETSALHEDFSRHGLWDDAKAADRARLAYAGSLIRIYLVRSKPEQREPTRALVSLIADRKRGSGYPGYRRIEDVMGDEGLRENLLQTALMELRAFRRKYEALRELSRVWDELERLERAHPMPASEESARASV